MGGMGRRHHGMEQGYRVRYSTLREHRLFTLGVRRQVLYLEERGHIKVTAEVYGKGKSRYEDRADCTRQITPSSIHWPNLGKQIRGVGVEVMLSFFPFYDIKCKLQNHTISLLGNWYATVNTRGILSTSPNELPGRKRT